MPSVELLRLRQQAVELAEFFPQPEIFARRLDLLLESYSARPSRKGEIKGTRAVLPSYQAPALVLKQVHLECIPLAQDEPQIALDIVDQLWPRRMLEPRQLAARLLGATPAAEAAQISERIRAWNGQNRETVLLSELGREATRYLRQQQPKVLLTLIEDLFAEEHWRHPALGLIALEALMRENQYPDLPSVFSLIAQFPPDPAKRLRPYWVDAYKALVEQSPKETLYHLQQRLAEAPDSSIPWLMRQLQNQFSGEQQADLLAALNS